MTLTNKNLEQKNNKVTPFENRMETDMIGTLTLSHDALYGVHTARANANFGLDLQTTSRDLITAMLTVKKACAMANYDTGQLEHPKKIAITSACDTLINAISMYETNPNDSNTAIINAFKTHPLQGGAGTSVNMNINEVIANTALISLGHQPGQYQFLHPIDDVNKSQSTNDTYPTALKIALIYKVRALADTLANLQNTLQEKESAYASVLKMGRTQLMDALPVTFGQVFGAFARAISRDRWRIYKAEERLREVNIGGTAVGTGLNTSVDYIYAVTQHLQDLTGLGIARADLLMDATQNADVYVEVSGLLKSLATNLLKISNDLRLMNSGPMAGLSEISLEAHQSGSSIMPGKVNPVMCEMINQICFRVIGADSAITLAASSGQFELNPYLPLIADELLKSLSYLINGITLFDDKCIKTLVVNSAHTTAMAMSSYALAAAFVDVLGYDTASAVAKEAYQEQCPIKTILLKHQYLTEEEIDARLKPHALTQPKR